MALPFRVGLLSIPWRRLYPGKTKGAQLTRSWAPFGAITRQRQAAPGDGGRLACGTQVGQLLLDRGVVARLHGERRRPARRVAQVAGVAEQLRQRDIRVQLAPPLVHAQVQDLAAPPVDVPGQRPEV